jgi:hypothetical protein
MLMHKAREAIMADQFPQYLIDFFAGFFKTKDAYPYVLRSFVVSRAGVADPGDLASQGLGC